MSQPRAEIKQKYFHLFWGVVGLNRTNLDVWMHERVAAAGSERKTHLQSKEATVIVASQKNKL